MDYRDSHCPYLLSSETTAKGTGLAESAGKEEGGGKEGGRGEGGGGGGRGGGGEGGGGGGGRWEMGREGDSRIQEGPVQLHGRLGADSWEASGVLDPDVKVHEWS